MTKPCGTPSRGVCGLEIELLITIGFVRFVKYDDNQFKAPWEQIDLSQKLSLLLGYSKLNAF